MEAKKRQLSLNCVRALMWLGVILFATGFYGNKVRTDGAPLPDVPFVRFLKAEGLPIMLAGVALMLGMLILGTKRPTSTACTSGPSCRTCSSSRPSRFW